MKDWWITQVEGRDWRKVATGVWFYDGTIPKPIAVWTKPSSDSYTRFDDDDQLDESMPIPETLDGLLYFSVPWAGGEFLTLDEAKASADAQPWGPVKWD